MVEIARGHDVAVHDLIDAVERGPGLGRQLRVHYLIERFFSKPKHFRHVATCYDKLATSFLAMVQLASLHPGKGPRCQLTGVDHLHSMSGTLP
jgi:hypothetical protein